METYCLLEKLKETIESDFRGKSLRFTSSLQMCTWTYRNLASFLMPTVSSSCTLIFFLTSLKGLILKSTLEFLITFKLKLSLHVVQALISISFVCGSGRGSMPYY